MGFLFMAKEGRYPRNAGAITRVQGRNVSSGARMTSRSRKLNSDWQRADLYRDLNIQYLERVNKLVFRHGNCVIHGCSVHSCGGTYGQHSNTRVRLKRLNQ